MLSFVTQQNTHIAPPTPPTHTCYLVSGFPRWKWEDGKVVENGAYISWSGIPGAGHVEPQYSSDYWDATSGPEQHLNENIDVRTRSLFVVVFIVVFIVVCLSYINFISF